MDRKDAEAAGHMLQSVHHSNKRRARFHEYRNKGFYMITVVVRQRLPLLGTLMVASRPYVSLSPLGAAIYHQEVGKITQVHPDVKVWRVCVMPDHLHMIIHVERDLPEGAHLGHVVRGFKTGCNRAFWGIHGKVEEGLFEPNYNDRLLFAGEQLKRWKRYLADNPRRLYVKRQMPQFFTVLHDMDIIGYQCEIVGNRFLLDIPDKMAVVVHRSDSDEAFDEHFKRWMACGERGGVLISAAIAPREKVVMREAMDRGYCVIVLRDMGFPDYYKPSGEAFDACAEGRLLLLSPWGYHSQKKKITRQECSCSTA